MTGPDDSPEEVGFLLVRRRAWSNKLKKEKTMLSYSLIFLIIALVAGALGMWGVAGVAGTIAKVLFIVFLVLFIISLLSGRKPSV